MLPISRFQKDKSQKSEEIPERPFSTSHVMVKQAHRQLFSATMPPACSQVESTTGKMPAIQFVWQKKQRIPSRLEPANGIATIK